MNYHYYALDLNPDDVKIVRGNEDDMLDWVVFNHHTRQWDSSDCGYWFDLCCIQAVDFVRDITEEEVRPLV